MRIKNVTTGKLIIGDLPGPSAGQGVILQGGEEEVLFNEDAEKSTQLKTFIDAALITVLNALEEPTSGTSVADPTTAAASGIPSSGATVDTISQAPPTGAGKVLVSTAADAAAWQSPPVAPPAAHAIGGAAHTADTLVNLNSKVSDRDLVADASKLDGIEAAATADQTGAEIKTAYEEEVNAFTNAQFTKLAGIEVDATADQTDGEIKTAYENNANTNAFTDADVSTLGGAEQTAAKGAADGYASLDSGGKIPTGQLPALAISDTFVVGNEAAQLALTAEVGDVAIRTDQSKSYILRLAGASTLGNWQELLSPTAGVTAVTGAAPITSSGGNAPEIGISAASGSAAGSMSSSDFTKLGGIDTGAKDDQTGAQIKTAYEGETNAFTDAQFTKLAGIDTSAKDDQTGAEIKTAYEAETNAFTDALFSKMASIASGATANDSNAQLRARSSHTGTQTKSTISDFTHGLGSADHTSATLAQLNALVSDATLDNSGATRDPSAQSVDAVTLRNISDSSATGGVPILFKLAFGGGTTVDLDVVMTHKIRVIDAWLVKTGNVAGVAGDTIAITSAFGNITDAMDMNVADKTIVRASQLDDSQHQINPGATLRIKIVSAVGASNGAIINIKAMRIL